MSLFLRQLYADHDRIRRLLTDLSRQLQALGPGVSTADRTLDLGMAGWMDYLDEVHHSREEQLYSRLRLRAPDAAKQVESLGWQHSELERHLENLAGVFSATPPADPGWRRLQVVQCQDMIRDYLHHLKWEEETFFPLAREYLHAADWDAVTQACAAETRRTSAPTSRNAAPSAVPRGRDSTGAPAAQ